jgi:hypothetical protein
MGRDDRETVVVEVQRSDSEVSMAASRRVTAETTLSSGELRGVLRLVPLLVRAMTLEARALR